MTNVELSGGEILVVTVAEQGPPGTGSTSDLTYTGIAGEDLTQGKMVYLVAGEALYGDNDLEVSCQTLLGVTTQPVEQDENVIIQTYGPITVSGWVWDLKLSPELYLKADGNIVQGLPTTGSFAQKIGFVISENTAFIRIQDYDTLTPVGGDLLLQNGNNLLLQNGNELLLQ